MKPRTSQDYRLPPETETVKVFARCDCGERSIRFRMVKEALVKLREAQLPPDTVVGSWPCHNCKEIVKVTARMLHIASAPIA